MGNIGLAAALIQAVEDLVSIGWGYSECYLTVDEKNTPALRLYKKLGYNSCCGRRERLTNIEAN